MGTEVEICMFCLPGQDCHVCEGSLTLPILRRVIVEYAAGMPSADVARSMAAHGESGMVGFSQDTDRNRYFEVLAWAKTAQRVVFLVDNGVSDLMRVAYRVHAAYGLPMEIRRADGRPVGNVDHYLAQLAVA